MKSSKPKTDNTTTEQDAVTKTSMYIKKELLNKVQFIAFMDDSIESQTSFINDAINEAVSKWEKKNGEAVKK